MTAPPSPIVGRRAIAGTGIPSATGTFCTSGHVTGVICDFQPTSLPVGTRRAYEHLAAGQSAVVGALRPGDSGGPVVSKDRRLLGIISGDVPNTHFIVYTPMAQVLHELSRYTLAPAN
ncbi:trypsin-like serine protease [Clavibacter capsici]|nr:trypsin-like serine protease [Clavibacter capsici]QIS40582.1 S1 family peptidase [Clavibacter capsici]